MTTRVASAVKLHATGVDRAPPRLISFALDFPETSFVDVAAARASSTTQEDRALPTLQISQRSKAPAPDILTMDSSSLKEAVIRQVQVESNTANVRVLLEVCSVLSCLRLADCDAPADRESRK